MRLPEQPRAWIPRAVLALDHPAPIADVQEQNPLRLAHCPGEMRDRGVDRDHQVERGHHRGGVGEIGECIFEADESGKFGKRRAVGVAEFLLQADELEVGLQQQRRQPRQGDAAIVVVLVSWLARPVEADARRLAARQACPPLPDPLVAFA
jgi:hypothetical protein